MRDMAEDCYDEGDYKTALEYFTKAAELGDEDAHYNLSFSYCDGEGVDKDGGKSAYHAEQAAIGGHLGARNNLGCYEWDNGNMERARKHFIIAANLGCHDSLYNLKRLYAKGHGSKEDYADALRAYQAAVDATKSSDREKVEEAIKKGEIKIHPSFYPGKTRSKGS